MRFETCFTVMFALISGNGLLAQSNVDSVDKYAWSENCGWTNWRDADAASAGVIVNSTYLEGFIWGENIGWINVGNGGGPYANDPGDSSTFGVNVDAGTGDLSGLAWGENVGWINFDTSGLGGDRARIDISASRFRGYAWGENIGWINLDDGDHFVAFVGACNQACVQDIDGSGDVRVPDLIKLLSCWGPLTGDPVCACLDIDASNDIRVPDLIAMLAKWGVCP